MSRGASIDPRLSLLTGLLQQAHRATDLHQVAQAVAGLLRDALPDSARARNQLKTLERRLLMALEDLYLAAMHPADSRAGLDASLSERLETAQAYFDSQIDQAARLLRRHGEHEVVLRAAAPAIASAALDIACRSCTRHALQVARDQEGLGAPPSLLFQLDGRLVWANRALTELTENRKLKRADLLGAAERFAAPLCAALRRREEPGARALRRRVIELGVLLRADVRRGKENGEVLLRIEVSEARRRTELSPRELQVATLVAQHGSYQATADALGVSIDSVRTHVRRLYRKLGVSSRLQLKERLIREGLLPTE